MLWKYEKENSSTARPCWKNRFSTYQFQEIKPTYKLILTSKRIYEYFHTHNQTHTVIFTLIPFADSHLNSCQLTHSFSYLYSLSGLHSHLYSCSHILILTVIYSLGLGTQQHIFCTCARNISFKRGSMTTCKKKSPAN